MKGAIAISFGYDRRTNDLGVSIHHPSAELPMCFEPKRALWIADCIRAFAIAINPGAVSEGPPGADNPDVDKIRHDAQMYRETLTPLLIAEMARISKETDDAMTPLDTQLGIEPTKN